MQAPARPPQPRGRPRAFDRDAALGRAMELFWARGYEATSTVTLAAAMGIHPPSLYAAFGDKKRLFLEAVDAYQARHAGFIAAALTEEPTAEAAVRRLLAEAATVYTDPSRPLGCMVVLAATNCGEGADDVAEALAAKRAAGEAAIRARIERGLAEGDVPGGTDGAALAAFVATVLHGMSLAARDGATAETLKASASLAMRAWPT